MYAKSKAFRNLVVVLAVMIILGAGLLLVKNLNAQGIFGSGGPSDAPNAASFGNSSGGYSSEQVIEDASSYSLSEAPTDEEPAE